MTDHTSARTFAQVLQEIEDGQLHGDLSRKMQDLLDALQEHAATSHKGNASGTLTLKINIALDGDGADVKAEFDVKLPKPRRARTIFFLTPENNLTRRNPRQSEMALRDITAPAAVRNV